MINYFTSSVEPKNLKNDLKSHAHQLLRIHDAAENIPFTKKIRVLLKKIISESITTCHTLKHVQLN